MKLSQKRAIGYAIARRNEEKRMKFIEDNGLLEEFKNSKYKTSWTFIRAWERKQEAR